MNNIYLTLICLIIPIHSFAEKNSNIQFEKSNIDSKKIEERAGVEGVLEVDIAKKEKLKNKSLDGSLFVLNCAECHGFDGNSVNPALPSIAGLNEKYIIRQLEDFKSGKRKNKEMTQIVREFPSTAELASLAKYFSKQTMVNQNTPASINNHQFVNLKLGEEIFTGKRFEYGIPACFSCHGKDGRGDKEGKYPRLSGQNMDYIILQMENFRSKDRSNDTPAQMQNIAKVMDDEDIASVAAYIAYIKSE